VIPGTESVRGPADYINTMDERRRYSDAAASKEKKTWETANLTTNVLKLRRNRVTCRISTRITIEAGPGREKIRKRFKQ